MLNIINKIKAYFGGYNKRVEEYERALWEHEQIGYKIYSLEVAIANLKEENHETTGA